MCTDRRALDELFSLTYEELRRRARSLVRQEARARLTPTTLVNECWLKLARSPAVAQTTPLHFRRIAARAMRQVLVEAARRHQAQCRAAEEVPLDLDSLSFACPLTTARDIVALDCALSLMEERMPRQYQVVEAHFFGGLSFEECARLLEISEATLMRDWRAARAWLAMTVRHSLDAAPASAGSARAVPPATCAQQLRL